MGTTKTPWRLLSEQDVFAGWFSMTFGLWGRIFFFNLRTTQVEKI